MSTFLELCQALRINSGISGQTGTPLAVTGQTGEMERIVSWTLSAYKEIQGLRTKWLFLRNEFSFQTIASTQEYTPAAVDLTEHGVWEEDNMTIYLTSTGVSGEQRMTYMPWEDFRHNYMFGTDREVEGFPYIYTIKPDQSLSFYPIPDGIYTVRGEYFKQPQTMTANTDTPVFPAKYHEMIMWRALMHYAAYAAAQERYDFGQLNYRRMLSEMMRTQLPTMDSGAELV